MKMKSMMTYLPTRIVKIKNTVNNNAGKDAEQLELSYIVGGASKQYNHSGKNVGSFL